MQTALSHRWTQTLGLERKQITLLLCIPLLQVVKIGHKFFKQMFWM